MSAVVRREAARRVSVRIGVLTIVALILMLVFAITAQNGVPGYVPGAGRTEIKASFEDVGPLRAGDEVRIAGVRAGYVEDIVLIDGAPVVDMRLDGNRPVYRDATARLGARSALGQKYVKLDPGTKEAGTMSAGATIPRERTQSSTELDQLLDTFDRKTRAATGRTLREVGGGLAGRGTDARDGLRAAPGLLSDLSTISVALTQGRGNDLAAMLRTAETLAGTLSGQTDAIAALTRDLTTTLEALDTDASAPLTETLRQAPATLREVRGALNALEKPLATTASATKRLRPAATKVGEATPAVRGLLREAVEPLAKVPGVADPLDQAVVDLTPLAHDLEPLVDQVRTTVDRAEAPLQELVPYLDEVINFFYRAGDGMSLGDKNGRWLRVSPVVTPETLLGLVPTKAPLTTREPYPAPKTVDTHASNPLEVFP